MYVCMYVCMTIDPHMAFTSLASAACGDQYYCQQGVRKPVSKGYYVTGTKDAPNTGQARTHCDIVPRADSMHASFVLCGAGC